jgi:uncharacterized protein (DUF1684 family)
LGRSGAAAQDRFTCFRKEEFALTMSRIVRWSAFALALFPLLCMDHSSAAQPAPETAAADSAQWQQDLAAWRAQREKEISAPDGWLTLAGLEWLKPGMNSVGAAADNQIKLHGEAPDHLGLLTVSGKIVQLLSPAGGFAADLKIDGQPAREGALTVDDRKPSTITWRSLTLVVLKRGDRYVLRIKDAASTARAAFHGLNWYAPDPRYRIVARWVPFTPPTIEKIPTVIGTTLDLPAPGIAEFTLDGQALRLEPVLEDPSGRTLFFILRDTTSKTTTYGAARFLHTGLPDNGLGQPGALVLDFNRLENPACAYTPYSTCPLPPEQNRLPVAIEAGEKRYED